MDKNKITTEDSATPDGASVENQIDKTGKKDKKQAKKSGFDFKSFDFNQLMDIDKLKQIASNMNETQWGMLAGGIFMIGYVFYEFVLMSPTVPQNAGMMTPVPSQQQGQAESAEEKFKRENKDVKLPDGSVIPESEVQDKTQMTQQVPFGDKDLEFRIRLPKTWFMSEFARYGLPGQENYAVLTNIARYFGPTIIDTRPYVWVETERLRRFMTAESWTKAYMIKRGISPQVFQIISPTEVQALYVDVRDLQSFAVRSLFRIEGDRMVMVSFGVPVDSYKDYKDIIGLSLNSFSLVRPIKREIEETRDYRLLNVMRFKYFTSWHPKNEWAESTLRPFVELHNPQEQWNEKGNKLQGLILVNVWRNSEHFTPESNMKEIRERLLQMNMTLQDESVQTNDLPLHSNFKTITRHEYLARVNNYVRRDQFDIVKSEQSLTNQEVWVTVMDNGYYRVYLTLVSPQKGSNYVIWAQNQAAYNMLIESMELRGAPAEMQ